MKRALRLFIVLLGLSSLRADATNNDPLLTDRTWLHQVLVYSYYWYLEDRFFVDLEAKQGLELWVRSIEPVARDSDDQSRFGELWFPQLGLRLRVKKADYPIPEFQLKVRAPHYRVVRGDYDSAGPAENEDTWTKVLFTQEEIETLLGNARRQLHVPRPERREFIVRVLREELRRAGVGDRRQTLYLAARTEVSNAIWVYWLEERTLWEFSGDLDGVDLAEMEHLPLSLRRYSLKDHVVASMAEARGNPTGVITRERASRALFLCLTRGEAVQIDPATP